MTEAVRFQTRARTVDHLGREQIADCPTAISELWKNSYDAYASRASLHIFDGDPVVACIFDNGHGMSRDEFVGKWLVIGTETKVGSPMGSLADRNGLLYRKRQGKKGIGRLSAAYIANLLLIVTKRRAQSFVAALIDWRVFENPFLVLDDIRIPVTEFSEKDNIFAELPKMYDTLMSNVWGDPTNLDHKNRVSEAWAAFDSLEKQQITEQRIFATTQSRIEKTLINESFSERHFAEWDVWNGRSVHGTAMMMSGVIPELEAQLKPGSKSASEKQSRDNFQDTLWSFVDPFTSVSQESPSSGICDFATQVVGWREETRLPIIEHGAGFEAHAAGNLEHIIDGRVDDQGVFRGRVKAFGQWLPEVVEIEPSEKLPQRADTRVGGFDFYATTMEFDRKNSTHSEEEFMQLQKLLDQFSGLMVFRDGFRVMPYGRPDADYFQIEERRSKHAGREFWNHRQMLGRIAISDFGNPNLKDKAGREGIIDNTASKAFKALVIDILKTSARRYFGTASEIRQNTLPGLQDTYTKQKKEEERKKLSVSKRRQFRKNLQNNIEPLHNLVKESASLRSKAATAGALVNETQISEIQQSLSALKQRRSGLRIGSAPARLAPKLQVLHADYRHEMQVLDADVIEIESAIHNALAIVQPTDPKGALQEQIEQQLKYIRRRFSGWEKRISELLQSESVRIATHSRSRISSLRAELEPLVQALGAGKLTYAAANRLVETTSEANDQENEMQLTGMIAVLESLSENINLDLLASENSDEVGKLRADLDRLNSLAQLGITVEIIDHELASLSSTVAYGLDHFPAEVRSTRAFRQVQEAYQALEGRLRFLSPLKLSGNPEYKQIYGLDIAHYIKDFFRRDLEAGEFSVESSQAFDQFKLHEQPSRIFPVFINLINNSRYWIQRNQLGDRQILLTVRQNKVIVSDNGPGVQAEDVADLFSLFFSKRQGGRGVGLYLCRANLAAGGHRISYLRDEKLNLLPGANFAIEFRDAVFPVMP